jgi:hypothetical protein
VIARRSGSAKAINLDVHRLALILLEIAYA